MSKRLRFAGLILLVLVVDQALKSAAQLALADTELAIAPGWGFTYVVNAGFWVWPSASLVGVSIASGAMALLWVFPLAFTLQYRKAYRASMWIELFFALYTTAVFGNVIDRLLWGGARDWLVTPIAITNLADLAVWGSLAMLAVEFWRFPRARQLLTLDSRRWWPR